MNPLLLLIPAAIVGLYYVGQSAGEEAASAEAGFDSLQKSVTLSEVNLKKWDPDLFYEMVDSGVSEDKQGEDCFWMILEVKHATGGSIPQHVLAFAGFGLCPQAGTATKSTGDTVEFAKNQLLDSLGIE